MKNERRHFLKQAGVTGAVFSLLPLLPAGALASSPSQLKKEDGIGIGVCEMTPEEMSGPYFINNKLLRRNITEDEQGIPLLLTMKVTDSVTCKPLDDILIDIWHCNAMGKYSGWKYINPDLEAPSDNIGTISRTDESTFLRGAHKDRQRRHSQIHHDFPWILCRKSYTYPFISKECECTKKTGR
ncbi:twin-arginine translocation signal domain-containing protein [Xenorhabdus bovienii]|uniref:dioxygenase family protein n=1 Tax=Xenorhabdus bovienii TaxID=40576 RepID=UPI0023B24DC6|nr:twin-arginine translocation signal domain-containing protein [Xenorhabdus bovienii]